MIDLKKLRESTLREASVELSSGTMLEILDQLEAAKLENANMRGALEDIASGEIVREYCHGPHCTEELGIATADEMSSRAAGALSFIDAAMAATKGDEA